MQKDSVYTDKILDEKARRLFANERKIKRLDGWFLIREISEEYESAHPFIPAGTEKSARAFAGMRTHSPLARRKRGVRGHPEGRVRQELRAHQSQLQSEHFQRLLRPCRGISRHRAERGIYRGAHRQGTPLIRTERIRPTAENSVRRGGKRYARGGVFRRTR